MGDVCQCYIACHAWWGELNKHQVDTYNWSQFHYLWTEVNNPFQPVYFAPFQDHRSSKHHLRVKSHTLHAEKYLRVKIICLKQDLHCLNCNLSMPLFSIFDRSWYEFDISILCCWDWVSPLESFATTKWEASRTRMLWNGG